MKPILLTFCGLALLFLLVIWNNKNNKNKLYNRKSRNFQINHNSRKEKNDMLKKSNFSK